MFCAGRVPEEDMKRTMKACGGSIISTTKDLTDTMLGTCEEFEEKQIGGERYLNFLEKLNRLMSYNSFCNIY